MDIMSNTHFWGTDLSKLPGFVAGVTEKLHWLMQEGAAEALLNLQLS
jgi:mannitol-1-phosphate/altronate dehydrogenase